MKANEAAMWVLNNEDNFVIFGKRVCKGPIYEEYSYVPVIRVGGNFYHIKYKEGCPKADYDSPVYVDTNFNIVEE